MSGEALFVGEANPYSSDPGYALYPWPERSAGGRLCRVILGLSVREYLSRFDRFDLCGDRWSIREAREAAGEICALHAGRTIVLLGSKVCKAFDVTFDPFTILNPEGLSKFALVYPEPTS